MSALLLLGACSTGPGLVDTGVVRVVGASDLPAPRRDDQAAGRRDYIIGPSDQLSIEVFGLPDLSRDEVRVDSGGYVSIPLAGVVEAAGKSPIELTAVITEQLRKGGSAIRK
ncbi:polysaccharide biosynthesis/export family protein [Sphingomonas sp. J344]|uniref:polysaccharide biosynthesis/export family protein n=1 Tax=Sphingomonas sp. J344 TaxID=2898434 RepID=UPI002150F019|nr:polysaccharide biosynthesis/export family protein [Sphingomonas sp. J344]MCR5871113.1 polysaccharide biosynthesis/export family protein [Sphingomonas sp. J344]